MGKDERLSVKQYHIEFYKRLGMSHEEAEDMVLADLDFDYELHTDSKMYNCRCAIKLLLKSELE